jgi:hypothetical protein
VNACLTNHVVNECNLIHDLTEWSNNFTQLLSTFAIRLEIPDWSKPRSKPILKCLDVLTKLGRLAVLLDEIGLEIEEINVAGTASHEELHDSLGLGCVVQPTIRPASLIIGKKLISTKE